METLGVRTMTRVSECNRIHATSSRFAPVPVDLPQPVMCAHYGDRAIVAYEDPGFPWLLATAYHDGRAGSITGPIREPFAENFAKEARLWLRAEEAS